MQLEDFNITWLLGTKKPKHTNLACLGWWIVCPPTAPFTCILNTLKELHPRLIYTLDCLFIVLGIVQQCLYWTEKKSFSIKSSKTWRYLLWQGLQKMSSTVLCCCFIRKLWGCWSIKIRDWNIITHINRKAALLPPISARVLLVTETIWKATIKTPERFLLFHWDWKSKSHILLMGTQ